MILEIDAPKVGLEVATVGLGEGGGGAIAEEKVELVLQIGGLVVLRCGAEQTDIGAETVARGDVADELVELTVSTGFVVAQAVAFVDDHETEIGFGVRGVELSGGERRGLAGSVVVVGSVVEVVVGIVGSVIANVVFAVGHVEKSGGIEGVGIVRGVGCDGFVRKRVGEVVAEQSSDVPGGGEMDVRSDGVGGGGVEVVDGVAPGPEHGGGRYDEHTPRARTIGRGLHQEVLDEQEGYDGFAQTHHVREEETAVLMQNVPALFDGIELIVEGREALGEVAGEGVAEVLIENVAKLVDEGFDVKLVGSEGGGGLLGTPAAGGGTHHLFEEGLRPRGGVGPLAPKPREVTVEGAAVAAEGGDDGRRTFEVVELGIAQQALAGEVGTPDDAARVGGTGEDVALGVEKLLVTVGVGAAVEVHVDALAGAVGEQQGEGAHVLLGDGERTEVGADEVGGVVGGFVLRLLHHRGVDVGVFADEQFDAGALATQKAFELGDEEGHAGQVPIAGGDVEGVETLVVETRAQHFAQTGRGIGVVDEAVGILGGEGIDTVHGWDVWEDRGGGGLPGGGEMTARTGLLPQVTRGGAPRREVCRLSGAHLTARAGLSEKGAGLPGERRSR